MRTIAVVSFKGGAGKTATAAALAGQFAQGGLEVLAVDADPQGGLTAALGIRDPALTTWDLLGPGTKLEEVMVERHGFHVVSADVRLAGAEFSTAFGWQDVLRDRLMGGDRDWDYVFVDSAPGLGVLPFMALRSTRQALIVCPPDFMSIRVIPRVLENCQRAKTEVLGICPTMVTTNTRHALEAMDNLRATYGDLLLPSIPRRVVVQDAALAGEPIQIYAPDSDVTSAYAALAERIM